MRCSQPHGLPGKAEEFLAQKAFRMNCCPICKRDDGYKKEAIGTYGMSDEITLYRYFLVDGSTADEYVQHTVWSSGPMIWLGLAWMGVAFEWTEKELEEGEGN